MNRKGFTLIELLGCLVLLGVVLCIGLYTTRGTLSTTLSTLTDVSENQIYKVTETYILENRITWINDGEEYTCVSVADLVDMGYFEENDISNYKNDFVKVVRNSKTKVINSFKLVNICE